MNTPYSHQQRRRGASVDCAGLITMTAQEVGLSSFDIRDYQRTPDGTLMQIARQQLVAMPISRIQPGDVIVLAWDGQPSHFGIVAPYPHGAGQLAWIHASNVRGKVVEHRLDAIARSRIVAAFKFPGVED